RRRRRTHPGESPGSGRPPYRVTKELVAMLARHHPLRVNTYFNHPAEITASSTEALARLADAGIPPGNQRRPARGGERLPPDHEDPVQKLVRNRVRPCYLYQCDLSEGLTHFRTPVSRGIEIIENLIGGTPAGSRFRPTSSTPPRAGGDPGDAPVPHLMGHEQGGVVELREGDHHLPGTRLRRASLVRPQMRNLRQYLTQGCRRVQSNRDRQTPLR
ncbi:MAG: hypothetical protein WAQ44_06685, partial [Candidatus Methanoculleus thermohydrogenotrophicum]